MYTPSFIKRENQYTSGNEYMLTRAPLVKGESEGYIGYYNITAEGPFTGRRFTAKSVALYPVKMTDNQQSSTYLELVSAKGKKTDLDFDDPIYSTIIPTAGDMKKGYFLRFFIQQRNDSDGRIKEIDKTQYDDLTNTTKGLNPAFYKSAVLRWRLTGPKNDITEAGIITTSGVEDTNRRTIKEKQNRMRGLFEFLANRLLEHTEYARTIDTNTDIKL